MAARKPPENWFWSHDIKPTQLDHVVTPGMRLVRLSSYGSGDARRFAALLYKAPGPDRSYAIELDAAALAARLAETGARPVGLTVSTDPDPAVRRFSVVLETGPGSPATLHVDLDEAELRARLDGQHGVVDLVTYVTGGSRRYAAILEDRPGPSWLVTGVTANQLDAQLIELDARLLRVRGYLERGQRWFAAVAEPTGAGSWAWYPDLDADRVARSLESNHAYPFDLDATRDDRGVTFAVVMYRDRG